MRAKPGVKAATNRKAIRTWTPVCATRTSWSSSPYARSMRCSGLSPREASFQSSCPTSGRSQLGQRLARVDTDRVP
jgi:hypothetical protein